MRLKISVTKIRYPIVRDNYNFFNNSVEVSCHVKSTIKRTRSQLLWWSESREIQWRNVIRLKAEFNFILFYAHKDVINFRYCKKNQFQLYRTSWNSSIKIKIKKTFLDHQYSSKNPMCDHCNNKSTLCFDFPSLQPVRRTFVKWSIWLVA